MNVAEAAYLAGLIDGEGTIALSRRHASEHRQLVLSITPQWQVQRGACGAPQRFRRRLRRADTLALTRMSIQDARFCARAGFEAVADEPLKLRNFPA
jgi:hypothetical protein